MKSFTSLALSSALLALLGTSAHAAITYVDAVEGGDGTNSGDTFETGTSPSSTTWVGPDATANSATQWNKRAFANNTTVFEGQADSGTPPELTTTITGLADGTYAIWTFYWDQTESGTQNWIISTGLTSGSLTTYSSPGQPAVTGATTTGVTKASDLTFVGTPLTVDGTSRDMYGVLLGEVVVSGGSAVNVFLGNDISTGNTNRAWYDGVGYEAVPEPSAALLGCLGALMLLRRRR